MIKTGIFTILFLICASSTYAQTPFWLQTNGTAGGWGQMVFPSNGDIFVLTRNALLQSTDQGSTWKTKRLNFLNSENKNGEHQLAISSQDFLFILHGDTLYRSKDNGDTWQDVLKGGFWNTSFLLSSTGYIFLYSEAPLSLRRSSDNGDTWTDIIARSPLLSQSTNLLRGSVTPSGKLILIQQDSSSFLYSNDNGETWGQQSILPFKFKGTFPMQGMKNGYLFCAGAIPVMNNNHVVTIRSTDNGKTWDSVTTSMSLLFSSDEFIGNVILNDSFQYSTDYGNTWQKIYFPASGWAGRGYPDSKGYIYWSGYQHTFRFNTINKISEELPVPIGEVYHVFVDHKGDVIADGEQFFSVSKNRGDTWSTAFVCNDSLYCWSLPDIAEDSSGGIYSAYYGVFFRTTDLGNTWTLTSVPHTSNDYFNGLGYHSGHMIVTTPNGNIFNCASDSGVLRSTDVGNSWTHVINGLQNTYPRAIDCDKSGVLYTFWRSFMYRSTDNGDSWEEMIDINHPIFFNTTDTNAEIDCLVTTPKGEIFAGTSHGIMMSDDQGLSWRIASGLSDSVHPQTLVASPNGDVFGVSTSIIYRPYKGTRWYNASSGLEYTDDLYSMAVGPDGTAYLGTFGRGIWRSQGVVNAVNNLKEPTISCVISPNPASNSVTISYVIDKPSIVRIDLCDALGRTLLPIAEEKQDPGKHTTNVSLDSLSDGMYFIRLMTSEGSQTQKIIIVK